MAATTQNIWEQPKPTTALTDPTPVKDRPIWEKERNVAKDIANVAPSAARTGLELAVPPVGAAETSALLPQMVRWIMSKSPFVDEQDLADFDASYQATIGPMDPVKDFGLQTFQENVTNPLLGEMERKQAETLPGKMVQRALEIGPSIYMGPGGLGQKALVTGGSAVAGPGGRALAEEAGLSPAWQNAADIGGTLAGGVSPMAYNRLVNPYPTPAVRQPSVNILRSRNVPMSVGQTSGNERLLRRELAAGQPEAWGEQQTAFTRAAAEEQGGFPPGTDTLSNRVMGTEFRRMGAEFDRIEAAANPVPFSQQLQNDLLDVATTYMENNPLVAPVVERTMNQLAQNAAANGGVLTGQGFASARSLIGEIVRSDATDPGVAEAMMRFQDVLDNELANVLSPADQAAFRTVRAQYRNMLPIEYAKSQQGQQKRLGAIDPQSLMSGIRNIEGRREVAAGQRPMTELAEAGGGILTKPNTSGTAENLRAQLAGLIPILGAGGGATAASMLPAELATNPAMLALGTLGAGAGFIAPKLRDAYTRSNFGQSIIGRNLAPRVDVDRAGLSALLALGARQAAEEGRR